MSQRKRPGKLQRMLKRAQQTGLVSMMPSADYGRSNCDLKKSSVIGSKSIAWEYNGKTAGRIHRAK